MKKLTTSVLTVVLSASFGIVKAQQDSLKTQEIEEVVVTALGISKAQKSVTYGVTSVKSDQIQGRPDASAFKALEGQVAGLNLNSVGGAIGSGETLTIRGNNTISGSNQALIIVDGVPISSNTFAEDGFTGSSVTASSRLSDIDPNNIAEITVIKGYAAATLYGTEGKNGVIIIKTKSGAKGKLGQKMNVSLMQSMFMNQAVLPKYQKKYGVGFQNLTTAYFFSNYGSDFSNTNLAHFIPNSYVSNGVVYTPHPYRFVPNVADDYNDFGIRSEFPELANEFIAYKPYNSVERFFENGVLSQTSLNITKGFENGSIGSSIAYHDETGVIPNNYLKRLNLSVGGSAALNDNLDFTGSISYINRDYVTPPISAGNGSGTTGAGTSILSDVYYTPISIPLMEMPFEGPISHRSVYYRAGNDIQNPRWTAKYAKSMENMDRFVFGSGLTYKFGAQKDKSLLYRFGLDAVNQKNEYRTPRGGRQNVLLNNGFYRTVNYAQKIYNHELIYSMDFKDVLIKDLGLNFIAGGQAKRNVFNQNGISSNNQQAFNVWEHSNFASSSGKNLLNNVDLDYRSAFNLLGAYASAEFNYSDYLFVTLQARNDWSSVLEKGNNSIFYPSAGVSFVPTSFFKDLQSKNLNLLKLRYSYGSSGNFPDPYQTRNVLGFGSNAWIVGGQTINTQFVSTFLGNPDLKPEVYKENEFGVESAMFNNRVKLNASYFMRTTKDLVVPSVALDYSTGSNATTLNVSKVNRRGLEIELGLTPVKNTDFKWDINSTFYADKSEVMEIPKGSDKVQIDGLAGGLGNYAVVGEQLGIMMGYDILRDANGNPIVTVDGYYQPTPDLQIIGDPNPDFTLGVVNNLSYKGFQFGMKWDYQQGGDVYSSTVASLIGRGLLLDYDRSNTFILPGVKADGTPNDIQTNATNYVFNYYSTGNNISGAIHKNAIWDATHLRLSELSLGYSVPKAFLENTPFSDFTVTLSGNNIWYRAFNMPKDARFDPSVSSTGVGNGQGFDFLTSVPVRRYGMSVKFTF